MKFNARSPMFKPTLPVCVYIYMAGFIMTLIKPTSQNMLA